MELFSTLASICLIGLAGKVCLTSILLGVFVRQARTTAAIIGVPSLLVGGVPLYSLLTA